jgi:hypothetical protein
VVVVLVDEVVDVALFTTSPDGVVVEVVDPEFPEVFDPELFPDDPTVVDGASVVDPPDGTVVVVEVVDVVVVEVVVVVVVDGALPTFAKEIIVAPEVPPYVVVVVPTTRLPEMPPALANRSPLSLRLSVPTNP